MYCSAHFQSRCQMEVDGERHAPAALTPRSPVTHHIGGWVGPRNSLDAYGRFHPHGDSIAFSMHAIKARGSGGGASHILNLGIRWW